MPDLLSTEELAALLRVSTRAIKKGGGCYGVRLVVTPIGGRNFFRPEDVEAFNAAVAKRRGLTCGRGVLAGRADREEEDAAARAAGLTWD